MASSGKLSKSQTSHLVLDTNFSKTANMFFEGLGVKLDGAGTDVQLLRSKNSTELHGADARLLMEFVNQLHRNVLWYDGGIFREHIKRWIYIAISLALLIAIPLVVTRLSGVELLSGKHQTTSAPLTPQITALLVGIIGIHRVLTSLLGKRRIVGRFWKARTLRPSPRKLIQS